MHPEGCGIGWFVAAKLEELFVGLSICRLPFRSIQVVITLGIHLFPFRTEKLSPTVPMVLRHSGRVGRRRFLRSEREGGIGSHPPPREKKVKERVSNPRLSLFLFSLSPKIILLFSLFLYCFLLFLPFPPLASRYSSNRSYANYLIVR